MSYSEAAKSGKFFQRTFEQARVDDLLQHVTSTGRMQNIHGLWIRSVAPQDQGFLWSFPTASRTSKLELAVFCPRLAGLQAIVGQVHQESVVDWDGFLVEKWIVRFDGESSLWEKRPLPPNYRHNLYDPHRLGNTYLAKQTKLSKLNPSPKNGGLDWKKSNTKKRRFKHIPILQIIWTS